MKLEPLMTIHADLKPPVDHGAGPSGTRLVFDVTGGHFEGARLRGTLRPSGGDWLLLDAEGVGHLDVRITIRSLDHFVRHAVFFFTDFIEFASHETLD